jgi:protein ImuA
VDLSSESAPAEGCAAAPGVDLAALTALHPSLWRASHRGRAGGRVWPSGFDALDAVLPGGGWPAGALTELLLPHPGVGEWRLLAPALAALQRAGAADGSAPPRGVMLFDPPARPCAWTLGALGLVLPQLLVVAPGATPAPSRRPPGRGRADVARRLPAADLRGALEQALASGQLGAVLAWLPARLGADTLRRLQIAAQAHAGPVFLFRAAETRSRPSASPLRLLLAPGAPDELRLRVLKRRGPPLAAPLVLALPPVLGAAARERARQARRLPSTADRVFRVPSEALAAV